MSDRQSEQRDVGFKFQPTDEELVLRYLINKLRGKPLPSNQYVKDCDVYGEEPWEIWEKFRAHPAPRPRFWCEDDEHDLYVFTPLKKRTVGGSRIDRRVRSGEGYWHGEDAGKVSWTPDRKICWINKRFKYRSAGGGKSNDGWIMHEFSLHKPAPSLGLDATSFDRYALCRIRKKEQKRKADAVQGKPKVYFLEIDDDEDDDEVKDEGKEIVIGGDELNLLKQQERSLNSAGGGAPAASPASSVGSVPEFFDPEIQKLMLLIETSPSSASDYRHPIRYKEEEWESFRKAIVMDFDYEQLR